MGTEVQWDILFVSTWYLNIGVEKILQKTLATSSNCKMKRPAAPNFLLTNQRAAFADKRALIGLLRQSPKWDHWTLTFEASRKQPATFLLKSNSIA